MQIDRSNYETWLIDWLDGNLTPGQVEQLDLFLNENPDLREESEELASINIKSPEISFRNKNSLIKSAGDLPQSQFEYLCVGYLEGDLSSGQEAELMNTVSQFPEKKLTFDFIQKMKITPRIVCYNYKSGLIKKTAGQKIMRLSVISLSSAAAIALLIILSLGVPRNPALPVKNISQNTKVESRIPQSPTISNSVNNTVIIKSIPIVKKKEMPEIDIHKTNSLLAESMPEVVPQDDLITSGNTDKKALLNKIPVSAVIDLTGAIVSRELISLKTELPYQTPEDGRSRLSKFIAKTFREKILKEDHLSDVPLKGYEYAEAGVAGLNKLLGWEMALEKNNGINGEPESVYFSSKILKFHAPVKKAEPLQ
jgi:hypothetical protein